MIRISLFVSVILTLGCTSINELIEKGEYNSAFKKSMHRITGHHHKQKHILLANKSLNLLTKKTLREIDTLIENSDGSNWPEIFWKYVLIEESQNTLANRVPPALVTTSLIDVSDPKRDARFNSAKLHHEQALIKIKAAHEGNKIDAQEAFYQLELSDQYIYNFQNHQSEKMESFYLGTTFVALDTNVSDPIARHIRASIDLPTRSRWHTFRRLHNSHTNFLLQINIVDVTISNDDEDCSTCSNTIEVEDGFEIIREWSVKDSAYIETKVQKYKTVSGWVKNCTQYKDAELEINLDILDLSSRQILHSKEISSYYSWSNDYSDSGGDSRAQECCPGNIGFCSMYPSDDAMFSSVIDEAIQDVHIAIASGDLNISPIAPIK